MPFAHTAPASCPLRGKMPVGQKGVVGLCYCASLIFSILLKFCS